MSIRKILATGQLSAVPESENFISKITDTFKMFSLGEDEVMDSSGVFWAGLTLATVTAGASSVYTRARAEDPTKEPMLKFFF